MRCSRSGSVTRISSKKCAGSRSFDWTSLKLPGCARSYRAHALPKKTDLRPGPRQRGSCSSTARADADWVRILEGVPRASASV